jgi:glc operon protein GlcG
MELPTRRMLTLEAARAAMAACEAKAREGGFRVVIAIVDDGGHAILLVRLDGTQWSSVETALGKARAAVAFKRPTRLLEEMINNGRTAFVSAPGPVAFLQGALPIEVEGVIIGAIGVSGVRASDDEVIAAAGVAVLAG